MRYLICSGTKQWNNHPRVWIALIITLLSCMLIAGCDMPGVNGNGNSNGVGNGNTGSCNGVNNCNATINTNSVGSGNSQSGTGVTPVQAAPTPPSPPTPTPPPESRFYRANWSRGMDGWMTSDNDWQTVNGLLVNDGIQHSTILAPYPPNDIADYSVQADIRLDRYSQDQGEVSFGIIVRSPDGSGGYQLSVCASAFTLVSCGGPNDPSYEIVLSDGDSPVIETPFRPHGAVWHTYRIDVQGNSITVWIDGGRVFQVTDDKYLSAGRVGLWSDRCQISVRSFTITAL